jgi:general stress protein YciG
MKMSDIHKRGFASMTPEQRKAVASKGGKAAWAQGVGHKWTPDEARIAGKKGGLRMRAPGKRGSKPNTSDDGTKGSP